jgi:hypothetical protein
MGTVSGGSGGAEDRNGAPVLRRVRPLAAAIWARLRKYSAHALVVAVVSAAVPVLLNTALSEDDRPPACPGAGCDGRNPQKEGCAADALSWHPASANPGALQVRYSKHTGTINSRRWCPSESTSRPKRAPCRRRPRIGRGIGRNTASR